MIKLFSIPVTGQNNFDSRLPFGQATLNFCLPRQLQLAKIYFFKLLCSKWTTCLGLVHPASKQERLLA